MAITSDGLTVDRVYSTGAVSGNLYSSFNVPIHSEEPRRDVRRRRAAQALGKQSA